MAVPADKNRPGAVPAVDDVRRIAAIVSPARNLQITECYARLSAAVAAY